eukprot:31295-Pelagococcus_subviridis.AAC.7
MHASGSAFPRGRIILASAGECTTIYYNNAAQKNESGARASERRYHRAHNLFSNTMNSRAKRGVCLLRNSSASRTRPRARPSGCPRTSRRDRTRRPTSLAR